MLGDSRLAAHGINGHDRSLESQHFQQFRDGRDFVALRVGDNLAKADRVRRGPGTDHVNRRFATCLVEAASQSLSVDCDHLTTGHLVKGRDPTQQATLKLRGLDRSKDRIEPVMRRNAVPEINDLAKPRAFRLRKLHDSHEVICATDHSADRDHDEGHERMVTFRVLGSDRLAK